MPATMAIIRPGEIDQWDQALYAFLAEKERRSGSMRTVQSYSRMLQHFFGAVAKTPERITSPEVFSWAHGIGLSGKRPSSITIGARLACLSSFYKFLIRMGLMAANPCEAIERPKTVPVGVDFNLVKARAGGNDQELRKVAYQCGRLPVIVKWWRDGRSPEGDRHGTQPHE